MKNESGFTIVEVIVAIIILSVGVLAIVGSNGTLGRMHNRGVVATTAATYAMEQLETLRGLGCNIGNGAVTRENVFAIQWRVAPNPNGRTQRVQAAVTYPVEDGTRSDVYETVIQCVQ